MKVNWLYSINVFVFSILFFTTFIHCHAKALSVRGSSLSINLNNEFVQSNIDVSLLNNSNLFTFENKQRDFLIEKFTEGYRMRSSQTKEIKTEPKHSVKVYIIIDNSTNPTIGASGSLFIFTLGFFPFLFAQSVEVKVDFFYADKKVYSTAYKDEIVYQRGNGILELLLYDLPNEPEHKEMLFESYGARLQKDIASFILTECFVDKKANKDFCKGIK